MSKTIYATFDDLVSAKHAIGELIRSGMPADSIRMGCKTVHPESDLNPAQNDYPQAAVPTPTATNSAPPDSPRDYNAGIENDNYNRDYQGDVDRDVAREMQLDRARANELGPDSDISQVPTPSGAYERDVDPAMETDLESRQDFGAMPGTFPDLRAPGPGNSSGDPSTSGQGTRYAGIAASANASTSPGTMTDFLWSSLPIDVAEKYRRLYEDGKAILVVENPNDSAETILRKEGAVDVQQQGYLA